MIKADQGHAALSRIARTYGQISLFDGNEAETRLKVSDEVIFDVLGWQTVPQHAWSVGLRV